MLSVTDGMEVGEAMVDTWMVRSGTILVLLALPFVTGCCSIGGSDNATETYEKLAHSSSEREQIEIVKSIASNAEQEQLRGLARYWMSHLDYLYEHPTLETFVESTLHESGYHDDELQRWVVEDLARRDDMDRRRSAWVFLCQTDWKIKEARLLEAVERERAAVKSGEYSSPMILDAIGRVGRRLYPDSDWWKSLIDPQFDN